MGQVSGVGRAIEAILQNLSLINHPFDEVRVYTPSPLSDQIRLPPLVRNIVLASGASAGFWEQVVLPRGHGGKHPLLCPSYTVPLFANCPTLLIHHGSYEGYPQAFPFLARNKARLAYSLSAHAACVVSTVSEHSKRDIVRFYKVAEHKVRVIPEGVNTHLFRPIADRELLAAWRRKILGDDVPMLMYVGKPTKRRNLPALIKAFAELKRDRNLPHKLLLVGMALAGSPFAHVIEELSIQADVVTQGYATSQEMALSYNAADLLVYPSSYEGFGMPVLEAMACGTPVIALDNTAFPEFSGGIAMLLPNAEVATLRDGIGSLIADPERRTAMASSGPDRAAKYDWKLITERYVALLRELTAR